MTTCYVIQRLEDDIAQYNAIVMKALKTYKAYHGRQVVVNVREGEDIPAAITDKFHSLLVEKGVIVEETRKAKTGKQIREDENK